MNEVQAQGDTAVIRSGLRARWRQFRTLFVERAANDLDDMSHAVDEQHGSGDGDSPP